MEHFYQKIEGWFTFPNLYSHLVNSLPANGTFVEVGSWKGQSLAFFIVECLRQNKQLNIFAVDTWKGSDEHQQIESVRTDQLFEEFRSNVAAVAQHFQALRMPSTEAAKTFAMESIDAVFIDAAHEYASVTNDLEAWYPKVKRGGFICGHDYSPAWPGVVRAVDHFFLKRRGEIINKGSELSWAAQKL